MKDPFDPLDQAVRETVESFRTRLFEWMTEEGMSMEQLAALAGIESGTVKRFRKGSTGIGAATMLKLSMSTGVSVDKLADQSLRLLNRITQLEQRIRDMQNGLSD